MTRANPDIPNFDMKSLHAPNYPRYKTPAPKNHPIPQTTYLCKIQMKAPILFYDRVTRRCRHRARLPQGWQSVGPCRVDTHVPIRPTEFGIRILSGPIRDLKIRVDSKFSPEPIQFGVERSDTDLGFRS